MCRGGEHLLTTGLATVRLAQSKRPIDSAPVTALRHMLENLASLVRQNGVVMQQVLMPSPPEPLGNSPGQ